MKATKYAEALQINLLGRGKIYDGYIFKSISNKGFHECVRHSVQTLWRTHPAEDLYNMPRHATWQWAIQKSADVNFQKEPILFQNLRNRCGRKATFQVHSTSSGRSVVPQERRPCEWQRPQWWCKSNLVRNRYSWRLRRRQTFRKRLGANKIEHGRERPPHVQNCLSKTMFWLS